MGEMYVNFIVRYYYAISPKLLTHKIEEGVRGGGGDLETPDVGRGLANASNCADHC